MSRQESGPQWEECTIGVASASATQDGRPLLWKTRDYPQAPDNEVYYNTSNAQCFVAVVNANGGPESEAWMGVNEHGFAILNANSSDLTLREVSGANGEFMRDALGTCRSVAEFRAMLDSTNSDRDTHANFGVIDSTGAAFIFEASPDTYWTYDASEAADGFIVRANFACNDTAGTGIEGRPGAERFTRSMNLVAELVAGSDLTCENLLGTQMRDFSDYASTAIPVPCYGCGSPDSLYGFINSFWSICSKNSVSAAVIHGVTPEATPWEPAFMSTLWVLLGHPAATIAVPYWPVGSAPAVSNGDSTAPLCDRARDIQREVFRCEANPHLVDSFRLLDGNGGGFWSEIFPAEELILAGTRARLNWWRSEPPRWSTMLSVEDSLANFALDVLLHLTPVLEDDIQDAAHVFLLGQNRPNPFNAATVVPYTVPHPAKVHLAVYDSRGRRVAVLADSYQEAGRYTATWDARGLASGTYLIRLAVGEELFTRKCAYVQ